jgi:hypothetical protein
MRSNAVAMKGLDGEAGLSVPWEWARDMGLRMYVGGYCYNDNESNSITGVSGRIMANIISGLDAQVQITHDNFYQTRGFFGLSWTFGPLHFSRMKQDTTFGRIGDRVIRNYTVVAPERSSTEYIGAAIDPATGKPYTFAHVASSAAPGGKGTINNPFNSITAAQAAHANIIFVHAGSVFSGGNASVHLNPGNIVMGDGAGAQNFVQVANLGSILLPQASAATSLPILSGAAGDSVVLASNTSFTGFRISNAAGNAIIGTGVQNVSMANIFIDHSGTDGIRLVNTTGGINIAGPVINDTTGSAINLIGGTGVTAFSGSTLINGAGGPAVNITGLASGGTVNFSNLQIDNRQAAGLSINGSSAGAVNFFGTTSINNQLASSGSAIEILNSSGTFNFNTVNVTNPSTMAASGNNAAVNLDSDAGATSSFHTLNIAATNATALRANDAGILVINPANSSNNIDTTAGGAISATGGAAVDITGTALNVNLKSVSSTNSPTYGISLVNTTGKVFGIYGNNAANTGGTITGAAMGGINLNSTGLVGIQWMNITNNGPAGIIATNASQLIVNASTFSNEGFGIRALNTPLLALNSDVFSGNTSANLSAEFTNGSSAVYSINNSQFASSTGDNVDVTGSSGSISFSAYNSIFSNSLANSTGINVNWAGSGSVSAQINQSSFVETGNSITGVAINNSSFSTVSITNDSYSTTGTGGIGFKNVLSSSGVLAATNNTIQFGGTGGIGFESSLTSPTATFASNKITDSAGGATGFQFDSISSGGVVSMNGNTVTLNGSGSGFVFSGPVSTPKFQLQSTANNTITGVTSSQYFFVTPSAATGSLLIDGATFTPQ